MAQKKNINENITKIKKALEDKKLIIGTERILKSLKKSSLKEVYLTQNCPDLIVNDIEHYANLQKCKVIKLDIDNEELGTTCKKPFSISVVGISS